MGALAPLPTPNAHPDPNPDPEPGPNPNPNPNPNPYPSPNPNPSQDPDGYLIEILPQGPMCAKPLDHAGVPAEGGEGYKDNSKK